MKYIQSELIECNQMDTHKDPNSPTNRSSSLCAYNLSKICSLTCQTGEYTPKERLTGNYYTYISGMNSEGIIYRETTYHISSHTGTFEGGALK